MVALGLVLLIRSTGLLLGVQVLALVLVLVLLGVASASAPQEDR